MALAIGLAMFLAALLLGRVAKTGGRMKPPPRWNNDNLNGMLVVPLIVTLIAAGVATDWDWLAGRGWQSARVTDYLAALAVVAAYVALSRLITAWQHRVVPSAAARPSTPPVEPQLKKAA